MAKSKSVSPMPRLYERLGGIGLTKKYVREQVLPSWWDDAAASNPAAYSEVLMLLSRHLGLDLASLRDDGADPKFGGDVRCKFMKRRDTTDDDLEVTRAIATQVATLAAVAAPAGEVPTQTASQIREQILAGGARWVDLENLVDFAWSIGIPVLHVSAFPPRTRKMHGLAARVQGRPTIVICLDRAQSGWLLFILAHELGHIMLGHVCDSEILLDEVVDPDSGEPDEVAANAFALELLTGRADARVTAEGRWPNATALSARAQEIGRAHHVDPGHVILNYAHSMGGAFFAVANAALKLYEPNANAPAMIRRKLNEHLDWSNLPGDTSEYVARITRSADAAPS